MKDFDRHYPRAKKAPYRTSLPVKVYAPDFQKYERLKAQWKSAHPDATAEEYCAAMRRIADEAGI